MIYRYPNNWTICFLNNIIKNFQAGFACGRKNESEGLPHLRMHNIGIEGKLDLDLIRKVPHALAQKHHFLQKGDILFCTTNSAKLVGKSAIFNLDGDYTFSNHLIRLRVIPEDIDPKMLQHFLWLQWKGGVFEEHCKNWVNQSTLPKEKLLSTRIPLPPLTEQHRIVAKLEKLLAKVDKCKERLEKIPAILKRFRQSVLTAACSGQLTEDWRKNNPSSIKIQEVLGKIKKERLDKAKSLTEKKRIEEIYQCQEKGNSNDLPEGWEYILLK